ncbi:uncharacterized protein LOC111247347 [Varroa destructor]|uniref:Uncharacterized protein n=2 Tax=Varroa TaxID=62624 RepID=A0A7M7JLS5_VARDE|nr:uncharacterized protein LOC111247347 [Varroa destructor]XP_022653885.1 uncharacterized protein LOC111247347 [Varroa destructor]XP_022653886.1 uncharacterized protein LOC111247347 [Varroa destructor]
MVPQDTPFEEQYARIICHHQDYFHRLQSRREKANKVATIRQHYYPEGEWGWAVSGCAFVVHLLTNGIVLAFAHLLGQVHQKWNHVPQINIGSRLMTTTPPKAYAMNKFNLRPSLELRFKPDEAKQLMKEIVNPLLDSIEKYDATIISQLTRRISEEVVRRLKELSDHANEEEEAVRPSTAASIRSLGDGTTGGRYKIICHTVIVENRGAGIRVSYGQQWDIDSDGAVSHFYASSCLQCICTVLAIFYY